MRFCLTPPGPLMYHEINEQPFIILIYWKVNSSPQRLISSIHMKKFLELYEKLPHIPEKTSGEDGSGSMAVCDLITEYILTQWYIPIHIHTVIETYVLTQWYSHMYLLYHIAICTHSMILPYIFTVWYSHTYSLYDIAICISVLTWSSRHIYCYY